jgi:hypothetical protein
MKEGDKRGVGNHPPGAEMKKGDYKGHPPRAAPRDANYMLNMVACLRTSSATVLRFEKLFELWIAIEA